MSQFKNLILSVDKSFYFGQTPPSTYETAQPQIEGRTQVVPHLDAAAPASGSESPVSGQEVVTRLIRNVNATTCAAGDAVKVATTDADLLRQTAGQCGTAGEACIGIVHHRNSGGIPQHDIGHVVIKGPCFANKVTGALSVGDLVEASATAGKVQAFTDTSTDDQTGAIVADAHNVIGKVITAAASGDAQVEIFVGRND